MAAAQRATSQAAMGCLGGIILPMRRSRHNFHVSIQLLACLTAAPIAPFDWLSYGGGCYSDASSPSTLRAANDYLSNFTKAGSLSDFTKTLAYPSQSTSSTMQSIANLSTSVPFCGTASANTALFLASDLSNYVNGQVINVCGGIQT